MALGYLRKLPALNASVFRRYLRYILAGVPVLLAYVLFDSASSILTRLIAPTVEMSPYFVLAVVVFAVAFASLTVTLLWRYSFRYIYQILNNGASSVRHLNNITKENCDSAVIFKSQVEDAADLFTDIRTEFYDLRQQLDNLSKNVYDIKTNIMSTPETNLIDKLRGYNEDTLKPYGPEKDFVDLKFCCHQGRDNFHRFLLDKIGSYRKGIGIPRKKAFSVDRVSPALVPIATDLFDARPVSDEDLNEWEEALSKADGFAGRGEISLSWRVCERHSGKQLQS